MLSDLHYRDDAGLWRDVNLSIKPNEQRINGGYDLINTTNSFQTYFSSDPSKGFRIESFEQSIATGLNARLGIYSAAGQQVTELKSNQVQGVVRDRRKVFYENIYPGIDLEKVLLKKGVESGYIINSPAFFSGIDGQVLRFSHEVELPQGWYVMAADGKQKTTDFSSPSFSVMMPDGSDGIKYNQVVVFDGTFSMDEIMEKIEFGEFGAEEGSSISNQPDKNKFFSSYSVRFQSGKIIVSYDLPLSWLQQPGRVFPVYVDPTVQLISAYNLYSFNANGSPYNTARNKARYQSLFLASDLTAEGIMPGATITAIDFAVSQRPGRDVTPFRIRLQNTTATTSNNWFTSGWTLVYGPTNIGRPAAGYWYTYNLDSEFIWDGDNLAVDISRDNTARSSGGGMYVRGIITNRAIHWSNNSGTWPFDDTSPTAYSYLPAIRLTYEYTITCSDPHSLAVYYITHDQAYVTWQDGELGTPAGYNVFYRKTGEPSWTELYTTNNYITLTGLDGNADYEVMVQTVCGISEGSSNWISGVFRTDLPPCNITSIDFSSSTPVPTFNSSEGIYYFDVCQGSTINLQADVDCIDCPPGTTYTWIINAYDGNGPASFATNPLSYFVEYNSGYDAAFIVNGGSCYSFIPARIRSSSGPAIHSISENLSGCIGAPIPVSIGTSGSQIEVEPYHGTTSATLGVGETTFIPDGPECPIQCYESSVTFTDFPLGSKIMGPSDVLFLRINMEHSFIGDLQISLVGPDNCGSVIILQDYYTIAQGGYDDDTYTWPHMSGSSFQRIGFGEPNTSDLGNIGGQDYCDESAWYNAPGTGWDYVWSNNENYSYAAGNAFVYEAVNMSSHSTLPYHRVNPSNPTNQTNFYKPYQGFENLIGCPLNGTWTVKVCDSWRADNGWIFEWEIALDADLLPSPWIYMPEIDNVDWNLGANASVEFISGGDPLIYEITPSLNLATNNYTGSLVVYDSYGCGTNTTVNYSVSGVPNIPEIATNDYIWSGYSSEIWDNSMPNNWLVKTTDGYKFADLSPAFNSNVFIIDYCRVNLMPRVTQAVEIRDLTIIDGGLTLLNNETLRVRGNFDNRAAFNAGNGTVIFNGSGLQNVSAGGDNFFNVTMNNSGSGVRLLGDDMRIAGTLNLTQGIINTNSHRVNILNPIATALSTGNANAYVFGQLRRAIQTNASTYSLPVGTATEYRLAQVLNNHLEGISYIDAEFITSFNNSGSLDPEKAHDFGTLYSSIAPEGIWRITPNEQPNLGSYSVRLWFNGGGHNAFANIIDNQFGVLRRPDGSSSAFDWTGEPGGGMLSPEFTPGRTLASGYAARNEVSSFSEFSIGKSDMPLPIELLTFTAQHKFGQVFLKWSTGSEINNDFFTLERSKDAIFSEIIGFVNGAGNSAQTLHYQFIDTMPLSGLSYYRLKQTDFDGSFEYSSWIPVDIEQTTEKLRVIAINQADGLMLRIFAPSLRPLEILLVDLYGRVIHREQYQPMSIGESRVLINMLPSATNTLQYRVTDGLDIANGKVIR
jgi:subtilisin-like proprotein convertase family protein